MSKTEHRFGLSRHPTTHEFNVNLDEVDFNNVIIEEMQATESAQQLSLFGQTQAQLTFDFDFDLETDSEPEEEEEEIPEGEHRYFVYAWRWRGDDRFAKIGRTCNGLQGVKTRMVKTYNPKDDPVPLGVRKCADKEESKETERYILNGLKRVRPDREWVEIDEAFNRLIEKSFSVVDIE